MAGVETEIGTVLDAYENAVNNSDVDRVISLFSLEGVVLAPESPSAVGRAAVKAAYEGIFQAIKLDISFEIAEIVDLSSGWAFARTHSTGTMLIHATGETVPEHNHELFLFQRQTADDGFKIARYSFSETK